MAKWLLLLQVCMVTGVTYIENVYELEKGELSHLVIEMSTGRIFVGATNWLYEFDKNLERTKEFRTGPKLDNPNCVPRIFTNHCECSLDDCEEKPKENFNKGLVIDYDHGHLIACSSLYHGYCEKHELNDITQIVQPTSFMPVVANNATASTFIFIGPGPVQDEKGHQEMALYVGATRTINGPLQTRDRLVPAFCSRKLTGDPAFDLCDKTVSTSTKIQVESQLRATFPIHYVYGFTDSRFSYMITIQKQSPSVESYVTKIIRVCNMDKKFFSYAELQLRCMHNGTLYNLAQAAFFGKAGIKLARTVGQGEDYLFVVFSTGSHNSPDTSPASTSALCVYPMQKTKSIFTKNIQQCFQGVGNTGPAHIIATTNCIVTKYQIDDNYCGEHNFNYYIDGNAIPAEAEAAVTFDAVASAVTIDIVNDYTVAFIGTTNGHLLKVSLEAQSNGYIYEDVAIDEGNKINADMFIDNRPGQYVYVMTPRKVIKTKLFECSQYKSCVTCLGARDPYCGWCALQNKCSLKTECEGYNQKPWLPYVNVSCPRIESVAPDAIQINHQKTTTLNVTVSHLQAVTDGNYVCVFSHGDNKLVTTNKMLQPRPANASNMIQCETPESFQLPPIPTGEDHIVMNLSVKIGGMDFDLTKFTFFDCSLHTETACTGCTLSNFPCTWCVDNHVCTHSPTKECLGNTLITGKHASNESGLLIGPEACPRIQLEGASNGKLLVPSGTRMKVPVKAIHLKKFQLPLKCFFRLTPGVTVDATVTKVAGDEWEVECDEVDFKYHGNASQINVPFQIYWSNSNPLDNPVKIQVIMFKCDAMAKTCGDCLLMDPSYHCGWCGDTCTTLNSQCPREKWHDHNSTCPDPEITKIEPLTGPKNGGTKLTIHGKNLGKELSDVLGGVTVAGVTCNLDSNAYAPPSKIVCKTEPYGSKLSGEVTVYISNLYQAVAPQLFTYVDPVLESISPGSGPVSGGTKVTIGGQNLSAGTAIAIRIGKYPCYVEERVGKSLTCKTSKAMAEDLNKFLFVEAEFDLQTVTSAQRFMYVSDPVVNKITKKKAIVSGGIPVGLEGQYLNYVQKAHMILEDASVNPMKKYTSECNNASEDGTSMICYSPQLPNNTIPPGSSAGKVFRYAFQMDNIILNRTADDPNDLFTIFGDPDFKPFEGNKEKTLKKADYLTISGVNLIGFTEEDVVVAIGTEFCNVTSIPPSGNSLLCKPPKSQPPSLQGGKYPEVIVRVGVNYTKKIGYLKYETEGLPLTVIIGIGAGILVVVVVFAVILYCVKRREQNATQKKWQIQMDNLEGKVAKECKEAFADLLTDMPDLQTDDFGKLNIPFLDYKTYCMRVLFPQDEDTHPVLRELEVEYSRQESIERGLKLFSQLIGNKTFLLIFIRTLESNKRFQMRDRVNVASLISVALQTKMEYATEILKNLLAELIEKSVDGKNHPRLLLRRTESVAEKMLTNWFTFLLYKFLRECAGETLYTLYEAIKQQVSKGPVDYFTSEARFSLSEDKLLRQQVDYFPLTIHVRDLDQFPSESHPVKVLDCDTITQVKEKILDAIYKNAPFSSRPPKETLDLVLFAQNPTPEWENSLKQQRLILSDLDSTSKQEGEYKRFNTLAHYQVPDGAFMALVLKQTSQSVHNLSLTSERSGSTKPWDYQRLESNYVYSGKSPSLNRTGFPSSAVDLENGTGNGVKYYHLVKQHDSESNREGDRGSKMVSEVFLTRLLATKGTLHKFVNDLFERIFSTTHREKVLPLAIKYMFDFLDDQALLHNIQDPDVVHTWKSNSLPLRFWVNVIKNPNFVFDIYKSNIVDSCLSVVAQNFMDSCSMCEVRLGKDSPSSKLLYAKHIPEYKQWVERYYQDIKMIPAISDQDMTAVMADESRAHQDEFNTQAALLELYKYVQQYQEDLTTALEEDEFARKNRLNLKLDQVHVAMKGEAYC